MSILKELYHKKKTSTKSWAALIDPDKWVNQKSFLNYLKKINTLQPDYIFLGGSTVQADDFKKVAHLIKVYSEIPLVIFPGSSLQISNDADAILFLSLISGRNPDYLIQHQVLAAPRLKKLDIEIIPTSYILIDGVSQSSVAYVSQTTPIPRNQSNILSHTALAGEMMGHSITYLDAGSGARKSVPNNMILALSEYISNPIIVGGGIKTEEDFLNKFKSGADIVVIGNVLENSTTIDVNFSKIRDHFNQQKSIL